MNLLETFSSYSARRASRCPSALAVPSTRWYRVLGVVFFVALAAFGTAAAAVNATTESATTKTTETAREKSAENETSDEVGGSTILDTLYTVPPIVIEAPRVTRGEYDVFKRSGFVAVLDVGDRRNRVEDLSAVLAQTVGVRVRRYGGLGSFATVSIRGSSSNQVDVFLDGVPLNDAYMGTTNLGSLPLDGIERVEVFRGFTPPHLGSSAIGGAVNLTTENDERWVAPSGITKAQLHLSYGSFDTAREVLSLWPQIGGVRVFAHVGHLASQGNFTFNDNRGTPENPDDDAVVERINNDFDSWNVLGRAFVTAPVLGDVSLSYNYFHREEGVPGVGSHQSATARADRGRHVAYLRVGPTSLAPERMTISAVGYYGEAYEKCNDPSGDITLLRQVTDNQFGTGGGNVRSTLDVPRLPIELELFLETKNEKFHPESTLPVPMSGPDRHRWSNAAAFTGDLVLEPFSLVLSATGRWQRHTNEFYDPPRFPWLPPTPQGKITRNEHSPQFGVRWLPTSYLTIKGNWGRYYRLPTFVELFGNTGSVTGSSDLVPEKGLNRDIGVMISRETLWRLRHIFLEVVYLDNEVEDLILFFPNSQVTSRPRNISSARIRGWETSFSSQIGDRLRFSGNYTHMDSKDTGPIPYYNGNDLPSRPKHDAGVFVDFLLNRWKVSYEYHHIGANYLDPANQKRLPARDIHNIAAKWWVFRDAVALTAEGRNLSDSQINDVGGFPLPGRSVYVTLSYQR